nr:response regulator [Hymenobacter sp. CCM 8763]
MEVVIVDDSRLARTELRHLLGAFPDVTVVGEARHAAEARELLATVRPDLLLLDIHMPGETGFELLASLEATPQVIFTTAYDEYALQAFEVNALDYLLKPVQTERLAAALAKRGPEPPRCPTRPQLRPRKPRLRRLPPRSPKTTKCLCATANSAGLCA